MAPILSLENINKRYPGVVALDSVDFAMDKGEVRGLLGKNGAGKSTLVKILSGAVIPDSGEIRVGGERVNIHKPRDAWNQGICTVYQEMSLVPGLTVAENILLGRWPQTGLGMGIINRSQIRKIAAAALDQLEVKLNLDEEVARLSVAQHQLIEIAKALSFDPQVLVLDEPTSALAANEVEVLHKVVRRLAAQGRAIIYVTHRLQEIPYVADSVTVLRDGKHIGTIAAGEATPARIANMMIGSDWQRTVRRHNGVGPGEVKLAVRHLSRAGALHDISFELRGGEVLGVAGLLGSGRTELVRAIFGRDAVDAGEVVVKGSVARHPNPVKMKTLGIGLTPEDRKRQGLVLIHSVKQNLLMAGLHRVSARGIMQPQREQAMAEQMVQSMAIKTPGLGVLAGTLSGGNQQKVVIGNWLNTLPDVLMMDEPTRGIDIQAKEQIFHLVRDLATQGMAVLFISSEIEEVLDVSDRILIMNQGRITAEVKPDQVNLEQLMTLVMEELGDGQNGRH